MSVRKGKRGEKEFKKYLEGVFQYENVEVWNNPLNWEGVDIVVKDNATGRPLRVFEVIIMLRLHG